MTLLPWDLLTSATLICECDVEININQSIIAIKRPNLHLVDEETKCKRTMCAAAIPWEAQLKCQQKRRQYRVGRQGGNISFLLLAKLFPGQTPFWPNMEGGEEVLLEGCFLVGLGRREVEGKVRENV